MGQNRHRVSTPKLFALILCAASACAAQDLQLERGAVGSYLCLKELQTTGSVLHVVAHPDDEDGAMLAYCARGLGARTMLFSITRGEGGANLISSDFFDELGALRTLEHLKSASYYGIEVFYSRAADYGYSKRLEEAKRQWQDGIPILEDLVEVIRRERPTVMLSRFAGDPRDGHGHHQMAGVVSRLAFEAASDPERFPQQIQRGLKPWQVQKLYIRAGARDQQATVAIPTGTYDPMIGRSYAQIARFGLGYQRSQGISGHAGAPGPQYSYYQLIKQSNEGKPPAKESSIFAGLDTSLAALASDAPNDNAVRTSLTRVGKELAETFATWNPSKRQQTVTALVAQLGALRAITAQQTRLSDRLKVGLQRFERKLQDAIIVISGLELTAWATTIDDSEVNHAVPGESVRVYVRMSNQSEFTVEPKELIVEEAGVERRTRESMPDRIEPGVVHDQKIDDWVINARPTRPHWSRASIASPLYDVSPGGEQRPLPRPTLIARLPVVIEGQRIDLAATVQTRLRHPEFGQVQYPLTTAPAMSVGFLSEAGIHPRGNREYRLPVVVRSCRPGSSTATVKLELPAGWTATPAAKSLRFDREDEELTVEFKIAIPAQTRDQEFRVAAVVSSNERVFRSGFETITARDLGRLNVYRNAIHKLSIVDVNISGQPKVGYIPGSGDKVAESLAVLGVNPTILSTADIAGADLSRFDVILVGVRAYAVREDIRTHNSRLLDFVKQGGTLIVQYQTPEFDNNYGPYPYVMGRRPEEVSEEDAAVSILKPEHPLFTSPNKITEEDFTGWFEQRGSKFWTTWDNRYTALLECHDSEQTPQEGGMLITKYGKGVYVYSAYAWYRQLPNGVPGAYRLFANMLSLPESELID